MPKGVFVKTREHIEKIAAANRGKHWKLSEETKQRMKSHIKSDEHRKKLSISAKNRVYLEEERKRRSERQKGVFPSKETRLKMSLARTKEKHPNWQGGKDEVAKKIRNSLEYRLWRMAVLTRDNKRCIWCGSGDRIEVDHIKPFAHYPELRFAIDNGRTLCHYCHKTTDTYGGNGGKNVKIS